MKIDFKTGAILMIIVVLGVYIANMWAHKMIAQEMKQKEYEAWVKAQTAIQPPATTA